MGKFFIGWAVFVIVGVIGWVMNIMKLFEVDLILSQLTMVEVLRIIGIFLAPLGTVMGYFV